MAGASQARFRRIDEMFDAALDLEPNELDAFVTAALDHVVARR